MPIIHLPKTVKGASKVFHAPAGQPTPSEIAARFPTEVPANLGLVPDRWLRRDQAAALIAKANGSDDVVMGASWLQSMTRAGMIDCRESDVRLLSESERVGAARPGSPEAAAEQARLSRLSADLKALGLRAVPEESV
jgi:hypothetical protein